MLEVPEAVDFPEPIVVRAGSRQDLSTPTHFEITVVTPTGERRVQRFTHQNVVRVQPECDPGVGPGSGSCSPYWKGVDEPHVSVILGKVDAEGDYAITLHCTTTGEKLTKIARGRYSEAACGAIPGRLGPFQRRACGHDLTGVIARFDHEHCSSRVHLSPLTNGSRVDFLRGPWRTAERQHYPEGEARRLADEQQVRSAWMARDSLITVSTPAAGAGHEALVRAMLVAEPPMAAEAFVVPACIATDRHAVGAVLAEKADLFPSFEKNRVIGARLGSLKEGSFLIRAGFRPGDVVYSFDGAPLGDLEAIDRFVDRLGKPGTVTIVLQRQDYPPAHPGGVRCLILDLADPRGTR